MKLKIIVFLFLWFLALSPLLAQHNDEEEQGDNDSSTLWDKIYVGGNFGLQFGYYTYIDVSPLVGYRITDKFSAGPGITYRFLKIRGYESSSTYGGRFFARHIIGKQFFAHTEYENLNTQVLDIFSGQGRLVRDWVPGFFIGGGIYQPIGERAAVVIYGLYNLLYDNIRSPYQSPWVFNVGFTI